jgi:dTDP-glucose pyrophosphorylase
LDFPEVLNPLVFKENEKVENLNLQIDALNKQIEVINHHLQKQERILSVLHFQANIAQNQVDIIKLQIEKIELEIKVIFGNIGAPPLGIFALDANLDDLKLPPVLIMAGGQGLRLRPITESKPKPLIEIAGKPILHRILYSLHESGFKEVFMSINYLGNQIKESVGDGSAFGLNVTYLLEESPMGTAGSIGLVSKIAPPGTLLVMNADLVVDLDFTELVEEHEKNKNEITIVVKENITNIPFGVIKIVENTVVGVEEKPSYTDLISAGVYCISGNITSKITTSPLDMPDLINGTIASGKRVGAFPIHRRWIDIGSHADLKLAQETMGGTS